MMSGTFCENDVYTLHDTHDGFFNNIATNPIFSTSEWDPIAEPKIWY